LVLCIPKLNMEHAI